jgi:DNA polymerase-3 subunit epsilon
VAVREFDARTERTDIHVFDQWCHVATVHDETDLADALQTRQRLAFDLDTYRLLVKRLAAPLGRDAGVFLLRAD